MRELQHVVERALLMSSGRTLELGWSAVPQRPAKQRGGEVTRVLTVHELREMEADNLRAALRESRGKVAGEGGAAELLGMRPTTLASRLEALGIDALEFRRAR